MRRAHRWIRRRATAWADSGDGDAFSPQWHAPSRRGEQQWPPARRVAAAASVGERRLPAAVIFFVFYLICRGFPGVGEGVTHPWKLVLRGGRVLPATANYICSYEKHGRVPALTNRFLPTSKNCFYSSGFGPSCIWFGLHP
jgi:hypothetical protein